MSFYRSLLIAGCGGNAKDSAPLSILDSPSWMPTATTMAELRTDLMTVDPQAAMMMPMQMTATTEETKPAEHPMTPMMVVVAMKPVAMKPVAMRLETIPEVQTRTVDAPSDIWEPNDTEGDAEDFGDQDGEEFDINGGYLYPDTDVDRYTFSVTDGWWDGWDFHFDVQVRLTGVPTTADLKLELWHLTNESGEPGFGLVGTSDEAAAGGDEAVSLSEIELTFWTDRGGQYEVIVSSSSGSSCTSPYTITVVADTR